MLLLLVVPVFFYDFNIVTSEIKGAAKIFQFSDKNKETSILGRFCFAYGEL
jgi:hypothetical protein